MRTILAKITSVVPASAVNVAMSYYFTEDAKTTIIGFVKENTGIIITVLALTALAYAYLLIRSARSEKKTHEGEELITATEHDPMTGLYNRSYFYEFAHRMYLEHPEKAMDAVVLNIERFHSVNAMNGQAYGDEVLRLIGRELLAFVSENEGIGGHSIGDHFAVYCRHMEDPHVLFNRVQGKLDEFSPNADILIRMGVMQWQEGTEPAQLFEHAQIARWREKYGVVIPVSVNLSRVDVFDPALEHTLDSPLEANGLDCSALKLEVTESAYTENADQVIEVIARLRDKGYEIEMDDFGSGYSSLNMLSSMPVDVLKTDRAFIMNIEHDEKEIQLVELIPGIARGLRVPVIAEGVETEAQLQLLKKLGCELVQGYYFSRPLPAEEFEQKYLQ